MMAIAAAPARDYAPLMRRVSDIETMPPAAKGRASSSSGLEDIAGAEAPSLFDAVLYPNRSLPNAGFIAVMSIVIGANIVFGTFFYVIGAWPVIGFCGLDIFLVWLAFKLSYRQGRLCERVRVTDEEMWVARVLPSGHETRWRLQPFWTRVEIDIPVRHESQVRVTSKGKTLILGAFLSPPERGRFAQALSNALGAARS
ncbi:hypothetical protein MNBD_ALPHA05-1997 [hydrothermal vent metagenome]|jgi:uncharacterized membrane protein|uniref:DUF2244 domain-containing protein n=1 Tax=hydrothermal vent metagenome TaxID=652676 RepID=A0A3B0RNW5_9ZZZZ